MTLKTLAMAILAVSFVSTVSAKAEPAKADAKVENKKPLTPAEQAEADAAAKAAADAAAPAAN